MNIRLFAAIAGGVMLLTAAAQTPSAKEYFIDAPQDAVPLLTPRDRQQMVTYFDASYASPTTNILGGKSQIISGDSSQIKVQLSSAAALQVAPVICRKDTFVIWIETLDLPAKDSRIAVYRMPGWEPVKAVKQPCLKDFIRPGVKELPQDIPSVFTAEAEYFPGQGIIRFTNTSIDSIITPQHIKDIMLPHRDYRFDGRSLNAVKK